jgi:hypothetical protein
MLEIFVIRSSKILKISNMDQEVLDARAKLAARMGKVQVGGKGKSLAQFS